ncbi:hypothetical protein P171DRAFT_492610 [Karstenula rhodostoma CBS 690.94]|uniref:Potassium channel tetramerisation-type BTB domain-containing protein n=1 Tax=Karstenula rhodostoma CBS 690.94 TaxID=1392251 RepID=A0A9P4PYR3_9PLEO|nr:hypothetical protein P171DRAFT_492610 [Karstenula rhodostoma CBS 690.94]
MGSEENEGDVKPGSSISPIDSDQPTGIIADDSESRIITLNVGGRHFRVYKSTLEDGHFFRSYLDPRFGSPRDKDGTFFIDSNPEIFSHVLRYLRSPSVYPLFWTKAKGLDHDLYNRLEEAAIFFRIPKLESWLNAKKYLKAVSVHSSVHIARLDAFPDYKSQDDLEVSGDVEIERKITQREGRVYLCPLNIPKHRGKQYKCDSWCFGAQGNKPPEYEDETYTEVLTTYTRHIVNTAVLMG